jgi:hypothetical protein
LRITRILKFLGLVDFEKYQVRLDLNLPPFSLVLFRASSVELHPRASYAIHQVPLLVAFVREMAVHGHLKNAVSSCANYWTGTVLNDAHRLQLEELLMALGASE